MIEFIKILFKSKAVRIIALIGLMMLLLDLLFPVPVNKFYSKEIIASDGSLLSAYLSKDDKWRFHTTLDEVSPNLIKAIIEKEDVWFFWHFGINPVSLVRALITNIVSGERVSGASTITMQLARMLEPKERNYLNKLIEIVRAVQIEIHYSKKEILEMYLSLLPYGGNIEGVKAASYIYFNRPPKRLSLSQAILLCVIPNDPKNLRLDRSTNLAVAKRNIWISKFIHEQLFTESDLKDALEEPVLVSRYALPTLTPHFSQYVKDHYEEDSIETNLDLKIQNTAEALLWNYVNRVSSKGVSNGAVLIIDNKNSSVIGYCGSSNFYDDSKSGQVNGITAIRSPGSTLKPALYAFAFDQGILTPKMRLLDIPTDFNGYEPENYDLKYYGDVTVEFALMNSLNIPAVQLLTKVKLEDFITLLSQSGFNEISKRKKDLGLSLILGGCGVTLEELTRLFSSFARNGYLYPLQYIEGKNESGVQIFSASSSYLIANILSGTSGEFLPEDFESNSFPKFAWKTGTSYGKRDAWAIGFNKDYTIGVWFGNFDGKGSPHLSGAEMAVPLLFDLFGAIDYSSKENWFEKPEDIYEREVCAETGLIPSPYCSDIIADYYIEGVSHNNVCDVHKPIYVNHERTVQYCTECLPSDGYEKIVYPIYDARLSTWFLENDIAFEGPPEHNQNCKARFTEDGPKIISPSKDYEYFVEDKSDQEMLLAAVSDGTVKTHYWFLNDNFYKKCKPGDRIFFKPHPGKLKITCLDDKGRDESITVIVKTF